MRSTQPKEGTTTGVELQIIMFKTRSKAIDKIAPMVMVGGMVMVRSLGRALEQEKTLTD